MQAVMLDTRDICKLMDQLEREIKNSEWWYGGRSGRTLEDIWASKEILGNGSTESLLGAFQSDKRIVVEFYLQSDLRRPGEKSAIAAKTLTEFTDMWTEISKEDCPMKPILMPNKMIYTRTFRFSERALNYFGPSVDYDFRQALDAPHIDPPTFGALISKLAKRKDAMIVLAFKGFEGIKMQCGMAIVIDCIPVLETLGPDFTMDDLEFSSVTALTAMMDILDLDNNDPEQRAQAHRELRDNFSTKMMSTFQEMPGFSKPSVLSKKLVKVPVKVVRAPMSRPDELNIVAHEELKLPYGAIEMCHQDKRFLSQLTEAYITSRDSDWMKLQPWYCEDLECNNRAHHHIAHTMWGAGSTEDPSNTSMTVFLFPVCEQKKCSIRVRQMIDMSMKAYEKLNRGEPAKLGCRYCEWCRKHEPDGGPLFQCCSRCKTVVYCGKDCQAKDWKRHKKACTDMPKIKAKKSSLKEGKIEFEYKKKPETH